MTEGAKGGSANGRLTRRAMIAGAGGAALAAPLLAQKLVDLGLPVTLADLDAALMTTFPRFFP